ncbi:hypothetical protein RFI_32935, partial [Reticulomyxa filosa]
YELTVENNNPTTSTYGKNVPSEQDRVYLKPYAVQTITPLFQAVAQFLVAKRIQMRGIETDTSLQLLQSANFVFDLSSTTHVHVQLHANMQSQSNMQSQLQSYLQSQSQSQLQLPRQSRAEGEIVSHNDTIEIELPLNKEQQMPPLGRRQNKYDFILAKHRGISWNCPGVLFFLAAELVLFWVAYNPYQFIAKHSGFAIFIVVAISHGLSVIFSGMLTYLHFTNLHLHLDMFFSWTHSLIFLEKELDHFSLKRQHAYLDFDRSCFLTYLQEIYSDYLTARFIQTRLQSPIADVVNFPIICCIKVRLQLFDRGSPLHWIDIVKSNIRILEMNSNQSRCSNKHVFCRSIELYFMCCVYCFRLFFIRLKIKYTDFLHLSIVCSFFIVQKKKDIVAMKNDKLQKKLTYTANMLNVKSLI